MRIIHTMRKQKAVWWARQGPDHYGKYSFADPVEIDCRWDDGAQEVRNQGGQISTFYATVYVDRVMNIGDMLKRGEMDSDTPDDPRGDANAHAIQRFEQNPDLKARDTLLTAYL